VFVAAEVRDGLATWVAELEPSLYAGADARTLLDVMSDIKRLAGAAELLLAKRVAETAEWNGASDRSAAHWLAKRTGTSVGEAKARLETVEKLADLPQTAEAFRAGRLSDQQVRAVADGAVADPKAEAGLLALADRESLKDLRDESRRAQACDNEGARQAAVHRRRSLRHWVDPDGSFRLALSTTALAGSQILTALKPFTDAAFKAAYKRGEREPLHAYAADGLVAMADAARGGTGPARTNNVKAILVVDVEALRRGSVEHGETCEIRGVGPVPVATARRLLGDAALAVVVKDGVDVQNVTHLRRRTTAHQRTALEFLGLRCDIEGCDSTDFVDIHHVVEWVRTHHTRLDELEASCKYHHRLKHKGWRRRPGPGRQPLLPPGHPDLDVDTDDRAPPAEKAA
jgi:hypothetical protein